MNKPPRLERDLEKRCVDKAKRRGWLARKMNGLGYRAWPDRLFIPMPSSFAFLRPVLWVEFKLPGEVPTPLQANIHKELRRRGQRVDVVTTEQQFDKLVEKFCD